MISIIRVLQPVNQAYDDEHRKLVAVELAGLSTDEKPLTYANGSLLKEMDTSKTYRFNKDLNEWVETHEGSGGGGGSATWGEILGDINNQTDLINILNTKEKNDTQKIKEFFETHEEFDYRFLISIANKPITEVAEFVELIINEYAQHAPVAMVPYDVGKMCLILKVNSDPLLGETFRCLIPSTGQILSVSMVDASGLVKFAYRFIGDEGETAKWGLITGNIDDQEDLNENFVDSDSYITNTEIDDLFS